MNLSKVSAVVIIASIFMFQGCSKDNVECGDVVTTNNVTLPKFLGKWYELASFDQFFSIGCKCTTAEYSMNANGTVKVFNSCNRFGTISDIEGFATMPDPTDPSKLKVTFPSFGSNEGDYWILEFANDGSYMLVGDEDRENLYILSRTPSLSKTTYDYLVRKADEQCFDITKLKVTSQQGC